MGESYIVNQGDCISSIAYTNGFFWETLWDQNADLKQLRKDPNVLMEGDVIQIPDLTLKQAASASEQRHKFKLKGVPARLRLKLMRLKTEQTLPNPATGGSISDGVDPDYQPPKNEEDPIANAKYILEVDGVITKQGKTDSEGCVEIPILPNACVGRLTFDKGTPAEKTITLDLGGMDPIMEMAGVRKRLTNLGFYCEDEGPADAPDFVAALNKFQERNSLDATGQLDDATRNKLRGAHGC